MSNWGTNWRVWSFSWVGGGIFLAADSSRVTAAMWIVFNSNINFVWSLHYLKFYSRHCWIWRGLPHLLERKTRWGSSAHTPKRMSSVGNCFPSCGEERGKVALKLMTAFMEEKNRAGLWKVGGKSGCHSISVPITSVFRPNLEVILASSFPQTQTLNNSYIFCLLKVSWICTLPPPPGPSP